MKRYGNDSGYSIRNLKYMRQFAVEYPDFPQHFCRHFASIKTAFHEFLQYAHNNPEKTFVLCDFKEALEINKYEEQKTALQFWEWYEYKIPNVIMPFWILNNIVGWDMIGRD